MNLFYDDHIQEGDVELCEDESRHISKVLRKKVGDKIWITDGRGNLFDGELKEIQKRFCLINARLVKTIPEPDHKLHIAIALTKNMDRVEWFLEKAVEIGVHQISFIVAQRNERRRVNNLARLEKIVVSAMKQSQRLFKPVLNDLLPFNDFISSFSAQEKYIAHCLDSPKLELREIVSALPKHAIVLIGPEGDFTEEEVGLAIECGYKSISLGEYRLRTETAAIVAVTLLSSFFAQRKGST